MVRTPSNDDALTTLGPAGKTPELDRASGSNCRPDLLPLRLDSGVVPRLFFVVERAARVAAF
jgi:hypothetical protein